MRAEYLPVGYANGASLPYDTAAFLRRVKTLAEEIAAFLPDGLAPAPDEREDHSSLQSGLPELLERANRPGPGFSFEQGELRTYLDSAPSDGLSAWQGELRSGARANLLDGRAFDPGRHQDRGRGGGTRLEKIAEPLCAAVAAGGPVASRSSRPGLAWTDPQLRPRLHLRLLRRPRGASGSGSVRLLAGPRLGRDRKGSRNGDAGHADEGPVILNPSPFDRAGVVELTLSGSGDVPQGGQILETVATGVEIRRAAAGTWAESSVSWRATGGWVRTAGRRERPSSKSSDGMRLDLVVDATKAADPSTAPSWPRPGPLRGRAGRGR